MGKNELNWIVEKVKNQSKADERRVRLWRRKQKGKELKNSKLIDANAAYGMWSIDRAELHIASHVVYIYYDESFFKFCWGDKHV